MQRVYDRWVKVLSLIVADNGDNTLVENSRGQLFTPVVLPMPDGHGAAMVDEDDEEEAADA